MNITVSVSLRPVNRPDHQIECTHLFSSADCYRL